MSGQELDSQPSPGTPGEVLVQAREAAGITQREVSDALHLPITTIAAIETGDRAHLPAHVFTRGYVRAYAKLLDLDPDPLVAALSFEQPAEHNNEPGETSPAGTARAAAGQLTDIDWLRQPRLSIFGAAAVVLVLVIWLFTGADEDATVEVPAEQAVTATQESEAVGEAQADTQPAAQVDVQTDTELTVSADVADAPSEEIVTAAEQAEQAESAAPDIDTNDVVLSEIAAPGGVETRRLTPSGADRLSLEFSEECWVEIKDADGAIMFGDLGRAGQRLEFVGAGPFRILLGYAPGVRLLYNAEPVALTPHTRNNVASLVLGQ